MDSKRPLVNSSTARFVATFLQQGVPVQISDYLVEPI
jgi:hypothetical protein